MQEKSGLRGEGYVDYHALKSKDSDYQPSFVQDLRIPVDEWYDEVTPYPASLRWAERFSVARKSVVVLGLLGVTGAAGYGVGVELTGQSNPVDWVAKVIGQGHGSDDDGVQPTPGTSAYAQ